VALGGDGKYVVTGDGKHLATGFPEKTAILWNTASGKKLQTFQHADSFTIALSSDGKHAFTGSLNMTAILWETFSGRKLQTFQHTDSVTSVALNGDGKHVWTSNKNTIRLWDPATGKERCRLYSFDAGKDWLVITPNGFFDGSEAAWRFVAYRVPSTLTLAYDDATRKRFHRPGLLAQVWKAEK
jgi:WD40 repeat protein